MARCHRLDWTGVLFSKSAHGLWSLNEAKDSLPDLHLPKRVSFRKNKNYLKLRNEGFTFLSSLLSNALSKIVYPLGLTSFFAGGLLI